MTPKMRAVVIEKYGDNGVVQLMDVPRPDPGPDEVLIKVRAAGINPLDWKIRDGAGQRVGMTLPIRLGSEVSGTVEKLGCDVGTLAKGQAVFGTVRSGGFADYVVAAAAGIVPKPTSLDFPHAASMPLGALTAWQAIFERGRLHRGQKILITGSSGSVGSLAVQLAKSAGAHVVAVASGRNADFVRGLGVDDFVDRDEHAFEEVVREMDLVFDTVGGEVFLRALRTLKRGGLLVTAVAFPKDEARALAVVAERVQCRPDGEQLATIRDLVDAGRLKPHLWAELPLTEVRQALTMSQGGRTRGKIVLDLSLR